MQETTIPPAIKLTRYSHGAGCGCKIAPKILDQILTSNIAMPDNDKLLVGNHSKDDAVSFPIPAEKSYIHNLRRGNIG